LKTRIFASASEEKKQSSTMVRHDQIKQGVLRKPNVKPTQVDDPKNPGRNPAREWGGGCGTCHTLLRISGSARSHVSLNAIWEVVLSRDIPIRSAQIRHLRYPRK